MWTVEIESDRKSHDPGVRSASATRIRNRTQNHLEIKCLQPAGNAWRHEELNVNHALVHKLNFPSSPGVHRQIASRLRDPRPKVPQDVRDAARVGRPITGYAH
jgi:hypothetical protein